MPGLKSHNNHYETLLLFRSIVSPIVSAGPSLRTALALLLVALLVVSGGWIASSQSADADQAADAEAEYVELEDGTQIWPYHSQTISHSTRTLPINVVVYGDAEIVEQILAQGAGEWEEVPEQQQDVSPDEESATIEGPRVDWDPAEGAVRYLALRTPGEGIHYWKPADYHLHDGEYFGSRHHVRAYVDPTDGTWTAIQAHREHWDWFRLRHTVHSVEEAQSHVDQRFQGREYAELRREQFGNSKGSDADGWVSVVELEQWLLAGGTMLVGFATTQRRIATALDRWDDTGSAVLLAGAIAVPYLFVRFGSIAAHGALPGIDPWLLVAAFLPVLVVGEPVLTYLAARRLDATPAFAVAALAFLVTLLFDYTVLGVQSLPLDTVVHHVAVVAAIGFIAAGASRSARDPDADLGHVRTGVLLWIVVGVLPLLRFVYPI